MQSRHLALIILSFSAIITVAYSKQCGPNETLSNCPTNCGKTCATMNGTINCPIILCNTPECVCDDGFVRQTDDYNSPCFPKSQCPPSTSSS